MNLFHVVLLALIQGMAELLPVSSSAHVILAEHELGLDPSSPEMVFLLVMLHTGTMGAVLFYFRRRWITLFKRDLTALIRTTILATLATGIVGLALKKVVEVVLLGGGSAEVEDLFRSRNAVGTALLASAALIFLSGKLFSKNASELKGGNSSLSNSGLGNIQALIIGAVQGICLPFRGFSRSGATISTALLLKVERALSEDFSFLLAVVLTPAVLARSIHKLHKSTMASGISLQDLAHQVLLPASLGMGCAFLSGLLALKILSGVLEKGKWSYFGVYCLAVALVMFLR